MARDLALISQPEPLSEEAALATPTAPPAAPSPGSPGNWGWSAPAPRRALKRWEAAGHVTRLTDDAGRSVILANTIEPTDPPSPPPCPADRADRPVGAHHAGGRPGPRPQWPVDLRRASRGRCGRSRWCPALLAEVGFAGVNIADTTAGRGKTASPAAVLTATVGRFAGGRGEIHEARAVAAIDAEIRAAQPVVDAHRGVHGRFEDDRPSS
jgi:hypothetical protein